MKRHITKATLGILFIGLLITTQTATTKADTPLPDINLLQQQVIVSSNLNTRQATTAAINYFQNTETPESLYLMYTATAGEPLTILLEGSYFVSSNATPYNFLCQSSRVVGTRFFGNSETDNPSCIQIPFTNQRSITFQSIPSRLNNNVLDITYHDLNSTNLKLHIVLLIGNPETSLIPVITPSGSTPEQVTEPETNVPEEPELTPPATQEEATPLTTRERLQQRLRQARGLTAPGITPPASPTPKIQPPATTPPLSPTATRLQTLQARRTSLLEQLQSRRRALLEVRRAQSVDLQETENNTDNETDTLPPSLDTEPPTINITPEITTTEGRIQTMQNERQELLKKRQLDLQARKERQTLLNQARKLWGQINIGYGFHKSQGTGTEELANIKAAADDIKNSLNDRSNEQISEDIIELQRLKGLFPRVEEE